MYISHLLILLLYLYRASFGIMAFSTSFIFLLVLTAQLALCQQQQQQQQVTVTHIRAGNGSGSLTDYLHTGSLQFPSFTTLLFSPGVHDMCEERVVVIRDVTSIALIGSDSTHTRSVQVGGGKVMEVIEPSTVIDCHDYNTGFAFINVSRLTLKQISIKRCGAYFDTILNHAQFVSSLTIVSVYMLTMDTVSLQNTGRNFNLVTVNVLGPSSITNVSVLQEIYEVINISLPLSYWQGGVLISYTDELSMEHSRSEDVIFTGLELSRESGSVSLSIKSLVLLYKADFEVGCPLLLLNISSCLLDSVSITLQSVTLHILLLDTGLVLHAAVIVKIEVISCVSVYQVHIQSVKLSANALNVSNKPVILEYGFLISYPLALHFENPFRGSGLSVKEIVISELQVINNYNINIYNKPLRYCTKKSGDNSHHQLLFTHCKLSRVLVNMCSACLQEDTDAVDTLHINISNTSFEFKNTGIAFDFGLFEVRCARNLLIENCAFAHNSGPGIFLFQSQITFSGNCTIYNNTAKYGGGILVRGTESLIFLSPHTVLNFTSNTAEITGGAIHIEDNGAESCFFQIDIRNNSHFKDIRSIADEQDIQIVFDTNTASIAGTTIWGGSMDTDTWCYMVAGGVKSYTEILPLLGVSNNIFSPSSIASSPVHVCYCYGNETMMCTGSLPWFIHTPSFSVYPGQSLELDIATAGQLNGLTPGLVEADVHVDWQHNTYNTIDVYIETLQKTQRIYRAECTKLIYTLYSSTVEDTVTLRLVLSKNVADVIENFIPDYLSIRDAMLFDIKVKRCPLGFRHSPSTLSCTCLKTILKYHNSTCDINTQTVERTATLWMNASFTGNNTQTLAVHQHCPFDYCDPNKLRVDLSSPDQQCAHNRSGILCGGCRTGLSLTLGSPKCRHCSNNFLSLLPAFAAAGLALVAVLTCLNLTVSVGTINALILYANIVKALHPVFFPSTTILSVFVAWLNLDIGLESCFYDGLDFYSLTWLQFVFPVYIWLLVGVMILTSHYSTTAAKLVSRDAVKVLATLFLLSYAKLLRTILTVLSFTYISYEDTDGATHRTAVWLYDGNVEFGRGKHIPLILAALSFGVLYIIPFTLLLLLAPFLQARSHYTALRWVNKLMPFLDAYQGPYSKRFRFWPGALLLVRVILLVTFALNSLGDPHMNLILIVTILICLLSLQWLLGVTLESAMPYRHAILSYLDAFYLVNLGVLSAWSLLETNNATSSLKTQNIVTYVLVGLAFMVSLCILVAHIYLQAKKVINLNKFWQKIKQRNDRPPVNTPHPQATCQEENQQPQREVVTTTFIDLREPLLTD